MLQLKNDHSTDTLGIINGILNVDEPKKMREDLRELVDHYLVSTEDEQEKREGMYSTFSALDKALLSIEGLAS